MVPAWWRINKINCYSKAVYQSNLQRQTYRLRSGDWPRWSLDLTLLKFFYRIFCSGKVIWDNLLVIFGIWRLRFESAAKIWAFLATPIARFNTVGLFYWIICSGRFIPANLLMTFGIWRKDESLIYNKCS